jgi:hypothetical protein
MRDDPTKREQRVLRVILLCSAIWITLTVAAMRVADMTMESRDIALGWRISTQVIVLLLSLLFLFLGEERLVKFVLGTVNVTPKEDKEMEGHWAIRITYKDIQNNREVVRTGTVQLSNTPIGLTLKGNKLLDDHSQEVVVESWVSEIAEVIHDGNGKTLLYSYKIRRPDNPDTFDKVGYVVATCTNNDVPKRIFRGDFVDIAIAPNATGEALRKGRVVIFKSHK